MRKIPVSALALLILSVSTSGLLAASLPKATMQAVMKSLQDASTEVRTAAAQVLTEVPDDAAVKTLEHALIASAEAPEQDALTKALIAADESGTPKRLADALSNPQFTWGAGAKPRAIEVIGKVGEKKMLKWLTDLVASDQEPAVKAAALRALAVIGAPPKKEEKK